MFVIAHHFVQEPDVFWASASEVIASIPPQMKLHSVYPSKDLKTGTCVWEASNAGEVQDFLDKLFGKLSKNVCYEVNEEIAIGLPKKLMEEVVL
jgi:hypothetical protein